MKKLLIYLVLISVLVSVVVAADTSLVQVSLVNQDPDPALAGNIVDLRFGVENSGATTANDIEIEFIPLYPFSLVSGESAIQEIGSLSPYQQDDDMRIIKYKVLVDKDAPAGLYELKLNYGESDSSTTLQKSVWVEVSSSDSAEIIYIDQVELIPGKITPLTFTITNVGAAPLRDVSFEWENEEDIVLPVGSDNTRYVKYLDVGESADITFNVIASATATPDLYKLDLSLSYDDSLTGERETIATRAGVYVGRATDFDVAYSSSSSGEYSFSIANIGSVAATSVTVRVPDQSGWQVSGSNSAIIGNLNEGDYTIASFTLQQGGARGMNGSLGDSSLLLEIAYTDSRGTRKIIEKTVSIGSSGSAFASDAFSGAENFGPGMRANQNQSAWKQFWSSAKWLVIIVAGVIVFFFAHRYYVRKKRADDSFTLKRALDEKKKSLRR